MTSDRHDIDLTCFSNELHPVDTHGARKKITLPNISGAYGITFQNDAQSMSNSICILELCGLNESFLNHYCSIMKFELDFLFLKFESCMFSINLLPKTAYDPGTASRSP